MPFHTHAFARRGISRFRTFGRARLLLVAGLLAGTLLAEHGTATDAPRSPDGALTAEQAGNLVRQSTGAIALDSLTSLSPDAALQLASHPGGLSLDGLTSVDPPLARVLAMHGWLAGVDGGLIDANAVLQKMDGLFSVDGNGAVNVQALLDRIESLRTDLPMAQAGADADTVPGEGDPWLSLGGLKTISSGVAGVLAMHHGPLLLDGLAELSPEVARALATHSGELSLAGLTSLSDDARAALAAHDGPVVLPDALLTTASGG